MHGPARKAALTPAGSSIGYPVCAPKTAVIAAAAFSSLSSGTTTLLGCCTIGRRRTMYINVSNPGASTQASAQASCCGNRVFVTSTTCEDISEPFTTGHVMSNTSGHVSNSFHGLGVFWDPGVVNGYCGCATGRTSNHTTTRSHSNTASYRMT